MKRNIMADYLSKLHLKYIHAAVRKVSDTGRTVPIGEPLNDSQLPVLRMIYDIDHQFILRILLF